MLARVHDFKSRSKDPETVFKTNKKRVSTYLTEALKDASTARRNSEMHESDPSLKLNSCARLAASPNTGVDALSKPGENKYKATGYFSAWPGPTDQCGNGHIFPNFPD